MGHPTKLWGYIDSEDDFAEENARAIAALPSEDADAGAPHSLLSREMFAVPLRGYLGQLITFGSYYNGVEQHWAEWRAAFEELLRALDWNEAHVWVETDLWGDFHCSWTRVRPQFAPTESDSERDISVDPTNATWVYRGPLGKYLRG